MSENWKMSHVTAVAYFGAILHGYFWLELIKNSFRQVKSLQKPQNMSFIDYYMPNWSGNLWKYRQK